MGYMKKLFKKLKNEDGVALILTLGILTLLLVLGVGFVMNMGLESGSTANYDYRVKARLVAEAGLERAIMELRAKAKKESFDGPIVPGGAWDADPWFYDKFKLHPGTFIGDPPPPSFSNLDTIVGANFTEQVGVETAGGSLSHVGKSIVKIIDCASQIYINDPNPKTQAILSRLFGKIGVASPDTVAQNIITKRNEINGYTTKEQVKWADGVAASIYNTIKDYITVHAYVDENVLDDAGNDVPFGRAPVNMNTASRPVLEAVLEGVEGVGTSYSNLIASVIITNRSLTYWSGFDQWIDTDPSLSGISSTIKQRVKDNANPNRKKPSATDYSTEFSFSSGGYYEIESTGKIYKRVGAVDVKVAEKTISAIVRVFKVKNITKKSHFDGTTDSNAKAFKTTVADSCPIISTDNRKKTPSDNPGYNSSIEYFIIKNAVKLGFWDNFQNDVDGGQLRFYSSTNGWGSGSTSVWIARPPDSTFTVVDNKLKLGGGYTPVGDLVGKGKSDGDADTAYVWKEFSLQMELTDLNGANMPPNDVGGPRDVDDPIPDNTDPDLGPVHVKGTFKVDWNSFNPGTNCFFNHLLDESPDDLHIGGSQQEWPVPQYHVPQVLFNRSGGTDDKVYVDQFFPKDQANGAQFIPEVATSYSENDWNTFDYKVTKDFYVMATNDINFFLLDKNGVGNQWSKRGWCIRSPLTKSGTIGVWGRGDWSFAGLHKTWAKIGYVRIIPGSPGSQYTFTNLAEYLFVDPAVSGGDPADSEYGYWESQFDAGETVGWGTIAGTLTIPDSAATATAQTEGIVFKTGDGASWSSILGSKKGIPTADSQVLKFRALFVTQDDKIHAPRWDAAVVADPFYSRTPVLEDITITYLPKAEILYSREVQK